MREPVLWLGVETLEVLALRLRAAEGDMVASTHEPRDTPGGRITRGSNVPLPMERESIVWVMEVNRESSRLQGEVHGQRSQRSSPGTICKI